MAATVCARSASSFKARLAVSFAAADWSSETLDFSSDDFAAIGRALPMRTAIFNLWSCRAGAGAKGAEFIADLALSTGAAIAAAGHLDVIAAMGV